MYWRSISELIVRDAKGGGDRVTVLPTSIVGPLRMHLAKLHLRFERQRGAGEPGRVAAHRTGQQVPELLEAAGVTDRHIGARA
jgi:hypothetical protein